MLRGSRTSHRYRTAWRELLHPLPIYARQAEWLKRDMVEMNESLLRQPYYTIKSYALPAAVGHLKNNNNNSNNNSGVEAILKRQRHVRSVEELQKLRDQLQFPGAVGPSPPQPLSTSTPMGIRESYAETYGTRLRPRYPESWDTVPPHQPSRGVL
ncbi:uncharacterized protein TM35_000381490 [Trypanosoma theileri]|uniref:Uncharacterized protein n=1 Tax=Trypanosoma theileri TaxID=67003 RepID=A0A1X0NJY4_9TRYP|nr:uncharacterized protein TM35_000381490 [Trypanosoma theileri]ORC85074.1 hypothetical protein TM35_000381490 [Trypanosoma theileri]